VSWKPCHKITHLLLILSFYTTDHAHFYKLDVTSDSEIAEVADRIRKEHGNPTVLVNNAGIGAPSFILETSMTYVRKVFEVNTIAHYALAKQFLPSMLRNDHGHIINIASMASFVTLGKNVPYSGSKAAALSMIDGMRQEAHNFYKAKRVLFR
jgi:all-trans-retinol dehydrogenase (NAD+)